MRRLLTSSALLASSALLLLGCAPASTVEASPAPASVSTEETSVPEVDPQVVVSLSGLTVTEEDGTNTASFDDPDALLALLEDATNELPEPVTVEIFPGEPSTLQRFEWDGLMLLADSKGTSPGWVLITGASVNGIPVITEDGVGVGSSRAELLDAGAIALGSEEDAETATELRIGRVEVSGTESSSMPGSVGSLFTMFVLEDDKVIRIITPADDFSDL